MDVKIRHWTVKEGTRVPEETMDLIVVIICTIYIHRSPNNSTEHCMLLHYATHAQCDDI